MNGIRNFIVGLVFIGLMVSTVQAAAPVFNSINPPGNISSDKGINQGFSVDTNQTMNFIWYIDGAQYGSTPSANTSSYSNNTAIVGNHNVTVIANNSNGTIFNKWIWTVNTPPGPGITNPNPSNTEVTTYNGSSKTFSININQTANVTWYRETVPVQTNNSVSDSTYLNTSPIGTYNITANVENQNGTDSITWNWSVIAIPPPTITRDPTSNPQSEINQNLPFSITIDQPVNITWFMNGTELFNQTLLKSSSYSNNTTPIGTYNITVNVENVNGTDTTTWIWSVVPIPVVISNPIPSSSTPSKLEDETITFSIDINQSVEVKWYIDGVLKQTNGSPPVTSASFTTSKSTADTYTVKATATNTTTSAFKEKTWTWKVEPKTFYSGNRIWDTSMSKNYTWNPQSFSGFYYDLDTDIGGETLTINDIDRSLGKGDIIYETKPIPINFEYASWGTYDVIGFMADRYFAGYRSNSFASSTDNLLTKRKLSKVLTDNDKSYNVKAGSPLKLEEGYEFRITELSTSGSSVMVGLFKDGGKVKEDIISEGNTFVYKKSLGSAKDMPILAIHIETVFAGMETSTVIVKGIFQISENYITVDNGDGFGEMEITSASSTGITMKNDGSVSLSAGDDFNLMGKINIIVADSSTLRFAPYVDISEPGTYELRGTVTKEKDFTWTPFNFEALIYNIDTGEGGETFLVERSNASSRTIAENKLTYTANPINKKFEHSGDGWNTYQSIGFMGDTYFAGYHKESSFVSSDRSLIEEGKLSKILIDEDKRYTLHIGNSLPLQEGYSVRIDEISRSGEALMFTILKDGKEIRTDISGGGKTFVYEVEVGKTDIPLFIFHIDQVFRGMETNSVFIDGVFQISEKFTTVSKGDSYGIMEVTSTTSSSIVMANKDSSITLGEGDTISIMGDIKIKVANDNSAVRFYPFKEIVVEEPLYLELDIPANVYQNEELTIKVTSDGVKVKGATITFGDTSIGTTDSSGELTYTPTESGTFIITASMEGYVSDDDDIEVLYQPKVLLVSAPLLSDRGETIVISVTSEGVGINGASVKFGSKDLGTTPASGNITYLPDEIGTFTISASKSGYQDATKDIDITDPGAKLVFSNLTIKPKIVDPGENVNITVEAANFGTLKEAQTMYLKVNGDEVASQDLILDPGEIVTIHFNMNRSKSGTYLVEVDGRSNTFRVKGLELGTTSIFVVGIISLLSMTAIIYSIAQGTLTMDIIAVKVQAFEKMLRHLVEK